MPLKKKLPKGVNFNEAILEELLTDLVSKENPSFPSITPALAEMNWYKTGKNVCFLESKELVDLLCNMKTEYTDNSANLSLPHKTFILALPKGVTHNGVAVRTALVTYGTHAEILNQYKEYGIADAGQIVGTANEKQLQIFFSDANSQNSSYISLGKESLLRALNSDGSDDFVGYMGTALHKRSDGITPSKSVGEEKYKVIKLIVNLSVYLSAKSECLRDGLPNKFKLPLGLEPIGANSSKHIMLPDNLKDYTPNQHKGVTFVSLKFRNLVNEKYYRCDEWKDKETGSRWVEVKPHLRGERKITPSTITE